MPSTNAKRAGGGGERGRGSLLAKAHTAPSDAYDLEVSALNTQTLAAWRESYCTAYASRGEQHLRQRSKLEAGGAWGGVTRLDACAGSRACTHGFGLCRDGGAAISAASDERAGPLTESADSTRPLDGCGCGGLPVSSMSTSTDTGDELSEREEEVGGRGPSCAVSAAASASASAAGDGDGDDEAEGLGPA